MISLHPRTVGSRTFQSLTIPANPRLGDCWIHKATGEKSFWYGGTSGAKAFVEFADNAAFRGMSAATTELILPENPELNQEITHGNRKWKWNGYLWKTVPAFVDVRGGTYPV